MMPEKDFTDRFNTTLSDAEEKAFQAWAGASGKQGDLVDYDLRGAWKADAKAAANGHLPDTWKKPNHPTFSVESKYSGPASGIEGDRWVKRGGKWAFLASEANLDNLGTEGLRGYFAEREPDVDLVLPDTMQQKLQRLYPNDAK